MTKSLRLIVFFAVLFPGTLYAQWSGLTGRITDVATGKPLQGVHVMLQGEGSGRAEYSTISDAGGIYRFSNVQPGSYDILVSYLGYGPQRITIRLEAGRVENLDIFLDPAFLSLGEVQVTSSRMEKAYRDEILPLSILTRYEVDGLAAISISDQLSLEPGLSLARDGIWGTSLNIRGLGEERIVTLVDGHRIETATDLAAGLSLLDMNDIERIEVVKGAASSIYGSGAMGGVVNIISRQGFYTEKRHLGGTFSGSYSSVNDLFAEHLSLNSSSKTLYASLSGTMRKASNTMTPHGELGNSRFADRALSVKFGARPFRNHEIDLSYQRVKGKDIGIPGGKVFAAPSKAMYPEEIREMIAIGYMIRHPGPSLQSVRLDAFHQFILRDVLLLPNTPPATPPGKRITPLEVSPTGYHNTTGIQAQANWKTGDAGKLIAGIDYWQRKLVSVRKKTIQTEMLDTLGQVVGTSITVRGEVGAPASVFRSGGLYLQENLGFFGGRLRTDFGARIDLVSVSSEEARDPVYLIIDGIRNDTPPNQRITFPASDVRDISWSLNAGMLYRLSETVQVTANMARSYRAPSLEERFKYIDLGSVVRLGDPNLEAEQGYFTDLGLKIWKPRINMQANLYLNHLQGLIVETPGVYIYNFIAASGEVFSDTLPALINANIRRALLTGVDLALEAMAAQRWILFSKFSFTRGMDLSENTDLRSIPPLNAIAGIRYNLPGYFRASLQCQMAARQGRVAEGEKETAGYARYDLYLQSERIRLPGMQLRIMSGMENIFNRPYTNHLSTNRGLVSIEPGRNIFMKLIASW